VTLSVGLGRIQQDPNASILVRKALGALSTPGLLVHDDGITIDGDGRITLRLNPDGGLTQDENGLAVIPPESEIEFGVDSFVNVGAEATGNRDWNARLTGDAPNFIESSVAIGTEDLSAESLTGETLLDAKLQVNSMSLAQLRLAYDTTSFGAFRASSEGDFELFIAGNNDHPAFHVMTGDGVYVPNRGGFRVNNGTIVEEFFAIKATFAYTGGGAFGGVAWQESVLTYIPNDQGDLRPTQDTVSVSVVSAPPAQLAGWSARLTGTNQIGIRIIWLNTMAPANIQFMIMVHRLNDDTTVV
jgi:hypothetical protein